MDLPSLRSLYAHHDWAVDVLLGLADELPSDKLAGARGAGYGSFFDVLGHVLSAEAVWLQRWRGGQGRLDQPTPTSVAELRERLAEHRQARWAFFDGLAPERLAEPVHYQNSTGKAFAEPLGQLMLHVAIHGAHHRSEAAELLTSLGRPAPPLDYVFHLRLAAGGEAPTAPSA
jgi:uncharacterized damage-inducible protein DinB